MVSVTSAVDLCGVCHLPDHTMTWHHHKDLLNPAQRCWLFAAVCVETIVGVDTHEPARRLTHGLCVTVRCQWNKKKDFAHTALKANASNIHLFNNRRRFHAARAAFHASFVPLKLRSLAARAAPPCRWRCVSRRFRDARAVRAALSCRLCRIININIIVNILSCFAPKPLLHVILRTTSD